MVRTIGIRLAGFLNILLLGSKFSALAVAVGALLAEDGNDLLDEGGINSLLEE